MPVSLLSEPPVSPSKTFTPSPSTTATSGQAVGAMAHCIPTERQTKTEEAEDSEQRLRYPTATVDAETINDVMAARLATCLLAHVLYLKSQVPL